MYKLEVIRTIWNVEEEEWIKYIKSIQSGSDHESTKKIEPKILYHETQLPFPPFIGLQIFDDRWYCSPIKSIEWHSESNKFVCRVENEFPGGYGDMYLTTEDICNLSSGWKPYE